MAKDTILWIVLFGLIFTCGCAKQRPQDTAVRVNDFVMSAKEFGQVFESSGYSAGEEDKEGFLEDLINRRLILQEAERQGLDKQREFLREIERFWEKTLLKNIINRKSKEFTTRVAVNEDEIRSRYDEMVDKRLIRTSYKQAYDQIKWQLLQDKQRKAFDAWLEGLREKARIEVNKGSLGIK